MKKTALKFIGSLLIAGLLTFVLSSGLAGQDKDLKTPPGDRSEAGVTVKKGEALPIPDLRQEITEQESKSPIVTTGPTDPGRIMHVDRTISGTSTLRVPVSSAEDLPPEMVREGLDDPDKMTGTDSRSYTTVLSVADQSYRSYGLSAGTVPNGAVISNVRYSIRIDDTGDENTFYPIDYEIWFSSSTQYSSYGYYYTCVYDNLGSLSSHTDNGYDDDPENDSDINLSNRSTSAFNGETVDQWFYIRIEDNISGGYGEVSWVYINIDWVAPDPNLIADYTPSGWPGPVVMSEGTGDQTDINTFYAGVTYYIDFAIVNRDQDITTTFYNELWTDYTYYDGWTYSSCLKDYYMPIYDVPMTFTAGDHWIAPWGDATDLIVESNEVDNYIYRHFTVYDRPVAPDLYTPSDYADCQSTSLTLDWEDLPEAETYHVIVDNNADWSSPEVNSFGVISSSYYVTGLSSNDTYYWAVQGNNPVGPGDWSAVWEFTTAPSGAPPVPGINSPANGNECESLTPTLDWNSVSGAASYAFQVDDNNDFSSPLYDYNGIGATAFSISGLSEGVTYFWRVASENSCGGQSSWSSTYHFTTLWEAAPPNLSSPAEGASCQPTTLTLTWEEVSGATSYQLLVDDNDNFSSPEFDQYDCYDGSQEVSGLSAGTTYFWTMRSHNVCGESDDWATPRSFTTEMPVPGTPTLSSPADGSDCEPLSLTFNWGSATNAHRYILQVDDNNDFSSPIYDNDDVSGTSQAVTGLDEAETYYWHVKASNGCGTEGSWSSMNDFSTTISSVGDPALSSPADAADCQPTSLTLSWSSASNANGYVVQVDDNNDFSSPEVDESVAGTSFNCVGLSETTTYYWRVKATGICSMESSWTASRSFETGSGGMSAPSLTSPSDESTNQDLTLTLAWGAVTDALEYHLQLDDNDDFSSPLVDEETTETSHEVSGLSESTSYYWHVQASGDCASGDWSDTWEFETEGGGTPVGNIHEDLQYSLEQNFPNPFSTASLITFTIPVDGEVSFDIYTPQGRLVRSESQFYSAGKHSFELRANKDMRAGVYLYRMRTDNYTSTRLCVVR